MYRNDFTPSSKSNISRQCTSEGKTFHKPFKIKMTPSRKLAPLSDGKKEQKKSQPFLVKDLLQSLKKEKPKNSFVTSASTQKKKKPVHHDSQPFLNTQSCEKPKNERAKSSFFGSRSQGLNSVRRQLYSDISKVSSESSQIDIKPTQFQKPSNPKPLVPKQIGTRKSQLMPPNTIKNQILRRSSNAVSSQDKKSTTTRSTIANVKIPQSKLFGKSLNKGARCEPVVSKQDNFTMTSPTEFPEETSGYIFLPSFKINVKIESQVQGDRAQLQRVKSTLEESIKSVAAHLAQLQFAHSTLMQILNSEEHPKNNVVKVYEDEGEEFQELGRLSTIGEVSCEIDNSCLSKEKIKTDEPEENKENKVFLSPPKNVKIPKTPRSGRRKTISGPVNMLRRRSERLSAKLVKSKSNPVEDEEDDSFANLENALHVLPDNDAIETLPQITSKSAPVTPRALQKWDKKNQGPLKEYMALKLNGTFLVTPDAKKFQSRIDGTETPHSRKSLSRKIFQELCDLYAESPEHN